MAIVDLSQTRGLIAKARRNDIIFITLGVTALLIAFATFVALFSNMLIDGIGRLRPEFFSNFASRHSEKAGILAAWVGTLYVMLVTAAVSVPLGIASGIYLEEYARKNWFTDLIEINISNLAGVPSIVYGLLALGLFVYGFGMGQSVQTAGLTLALLILPIVIVATREALRSVPGTMREGAYALGATQWQTVAHHVLPASMPGVLTGVILGLSRAIGETAPIITIGALTFIAFLPPDPIQSTFPFLSFEWMSSPFTVMPIQIFNWTSRPDPEFHANASAAALVLVLMTLLMNGLAIWLRARLRRNLKW
jgi:phosphate transport system permease protein